MTRPIRCIECGEELDADEPGYCESCDPQGFECPWCGEYPCSARGHGDGLCNGEREARQVAQDAHDWSIDLALQRAPKER